jgi:hypothetical protein
MKYEARPALRKIGAPNVMARAKTIDSTSHTRAVTVHDGTPSGSAAGPRAYSTNGSTAT